MKALILSAGLGTGLLPLTKEVPKVMIKVGGKPVLEHLIRLCVFHGIRDIAINLHYLPNIITEYLGDGLEFGANIVYFYERDKIMGGAGAIKQAYDYFKDDDFFVLNGDMVTNLDLKKMMKYHKLKKAVGTFLVHPTNHPYDSECVEFDKNFRITKIFRPKPGDRFKSISKSGAHIFSPSVFKYIPARVEFSLEHQLLPLLIKRNLSCFAYYSDEYSKDMGAPERLKKAREDFEQGKIIPYYLSSKTDTK